MSKRGFWRGFGSLLTGLGVTFKRMFGKNATIQYPHVPVPVSPMYRGPVRLIAEEVASEHKCIGCLACQRICPTHAIPILTVAKNEQNKNYPVDFVIDDALCCFCGLCVDVCPTVALEHSRIGDMAVEYQALLRREIMHDGAITSDNFPTSTGKSKEANHERVPVHCWSIITLGGGLLAVVARNLFHASLGLAMTLTGTAGLFVPIGGELIAVVQILVYLGAAAVSIVFILMLSPPFYLKRPNRNAMKVVGAIGVVLIFAVPLMRAVMSVSASEPLNHTVPTVDQIGRALLTEFVFPFEIISVLLTVAIIGAIVLARDLPEDKAHHAQSEYNTGGR